MPAALRQLPAYIGVAESAMSNSLAAWVGAVGMNARKRGFSTGTLAGASVSAKMPQRRLAADAVLGHRLARRRRDLRRRARPREWPRLRMQPLAHVGDDALGRRSISGVTVCIAAGSAVDPADVGSRSALTSPSFRPGPAPA